VRKKYPLRGGGFTCRKERPELISLKKKGGLVSGEEGTAVHLPAAGRGGGGRKDPPGH